MKINPIKLSFAYALFACIALSSSISAEEIITKAVAMIHPTENNTTHGTVTFTSEPGGVRITAYINGLTPGEHGFHIHEFGDCSALNASSAGGHFNPSKKIHGCPNDPEHHVGDMGNIVANQAGYARYDAINKDIKFSGNESIIGRAIIIHADKDDCKTQPTGNAGARVGCGVIGIAK